MKCPDPIAVLRKICKSHSADGQFNVHTADMSFAEMLRVARTSLRGRQRQRVLFVTPDDAKMILLSLQSQAERLRKSVREDAVKRYAEQMRPEAKDSLNQIAHRSDELAIQLIKQGF